MEIVMAVKIHLFGKLKEMAGSSELMLEGIGDTDELTAEMVKRFPKMSGLPCLIAVDRSIIHSNTKLKEGQELALLPPYSGG
jgi:molybdopterin synthase sulfur carrier subunit